MMFKLFLTWLLILKSGLTGSNMLALIDGDILVYRVGFASQDVEVHFAEARMDKMIEDICKANNTDQYKVYITSDDHSNFRYGIYPEYKANRTAPKPTYYKELRAYLIAAHEAQEIFGKEADDALADAQGENTVLCTIDKDLDQVVGRHYDFVKDIAYTVDEERALRFFYFQLLTGDRTDNIVGIEGIGPAKATKILAGVESSEPALFRAVRAEYEKHYKERGDELMLLNGRLLKIGGPIWDMPKELEQESIEVISNDMSEQPLIELN